MANYRKWTHEEDIVLMSHLSQEGKTEGFKRAAQELGRTESSCRSRYYSKRISTEEIHGFYSNEEGPKKKKRGIWYSIISFFKRSK